jgi:hemoglobin
MYGDWVFTAVTPDGKPMDVDYSKCRGCHLPLNEKDFVHRYDEYFAKRGH